MAVRAVRPDSRMVHSQHKDSPILRIPCEVTSEIFQHCLPDDDFPRPSVKSGPVQLSHVCSTWRELVIQTPYLWSKVLLSSTCDSEDTNGASPANMEAHVEALEMWMCRASPLRLSVHLQYPSLPQLRGPIKGLDQIPPAFRVIVKNATRWKAVGLSMPGLHLTIALFSTQENVRKLESLHINDTSIPISGPIEYDMPANLFLTAHTAETLSTLSVRGSLAYPPVIAIPFVRLHTLSLKHTSPYQCLHILKYCPVLEDLNLSFYDLPDIVFLPDSPATLPRLRNFRLSHTGNDEDGSSSLPLDRGGEIGLLLDNLQLPNLREFYLWMTIVESARDEDPSLPWDFLSRLITRSNCSLNRLELCSTLIDTPSILECLRLSHDLKHLGIPADEELELKVPKVLPSLDSLRIFR